MSELLTSPLVWAATWAACGTAKVVIALSRQSVLNFYDVCHSIVFGPVSLVTEILEIFVSNRSEKAAISESNEVAVDSAIEASRKLGEAIEAAAASIEAIESTKEEKEEMASVR